MSYKDSEIYAKHGKAVIIDKAKRSVYQQIENLCDERFDPSKGFESHKNFKHLKENIVEKIKEYISQNKKKSAQSKIMSFFSCNGWHGSAGLNRAVNLKNAIENCDGIEHMAGLIQNLNGGNYHKTSLRTYLAKAFLQTFSPVGVSAEFTGSYDKDVGIKLAPLHIIQLMSVSKADISVEDFFQSVLNKIQNCFKKLEFPLFRE